MCSLLTFLSFFIFMFVEFLLFNKDGFSYHLVFFSDFDLQETLNLALGLVWLLCSQLVLPSER